MTTKYTYENGILVREGQTGPHTPLAVICDPDELLEAADAYRLYGPFSPFVIPASTTKAIESTDDDALVHLGTLFGRYEVPIGLLSKLLVLRDYNLVFILDDSGSMENETDLHASDYMSEFMRGRGHPTGSKLTRWSEQEDRLHLLMEFLCWIPTGKITIGFLNRSHKLVLRGCADTPRPYPLECLDTARRFIQQTFAIRPCGQTPIWTRLEEAPSLNTKTMTYLFTDGVPTDASIQELKRYISQRASPDLNPLTLVSCTAEDDEVAWMREVDEEAPFVAEIDDYATERGEVMSKQGEGFPYSKGMWIMCLLVAAIHPHDLDALDEAKPLTLEALSELMGRLLTREEYALYMSRRPVQGIVTRIKSWLKRVYPF